MYELFNILKSNNNFFIGNPWGVRADQEAELVAEQYLDASDRGWDDWHDQWGPAHPQQDHIWLRERGTQPQQALQLPGRAHALEQQAPQKPHLYVWKPWLPWPDPLLS